MSITDWKSPGTVESRNVGLGTAWTNCDNAKVSDNAYATTPLLIEYPTQALACINFDFSEIPDGSIIDGVEVGVERYVYYEEEGEYANDFNTPILCTEDNPNGVGDSKPQGYWPISDPDDYELYGGAADGWNAGLTWVKVKNPSFGVLLRAFAAGYPRVDHVRMRVAYTPISGKLLYLLFDSNVVKGGRSCLLMDTEMQARYWGYLMLESVIQARTRRYLLTETELVKGGAGYLVIQPNLIFAGGGYMPFITTMVPRIVKPISGAVFQRISSVSKEI